MGKCVIDIGLVATMAQVSDIYYCLCLWSTFNTGASLVSCMVSGYWCSGFTWENERFNSIISTKCNNLGIYDITLSVIVMPSVSCIYKLTVWSFFISIPDIRLQNFGLNPKHKHICPCPYIWLHQSSITQCLLVFSFKFIYIRCQVIQYSRMDVGWTPQTYGGEKLYILYSDNCASWLLIGWWWVSRQNICQLILRIWDFRRFQIVRTADTKLSLHTSKCEKQVSSHLGSWHDFHQQPEVLISSFKHIYINVVVEIKTSISKTANFSYRILSLKSVLKRPIIYQVNLKLYLLGCWQKFHLWQLKVAKL